MKTWLTPTAVEDKFIPNEAVSTCYAVACDWREADKYEEKLGIKGGYGYVWDSGSHQYIGKVEHSEGGCGSYSSQTLTVKNGLLTNIEEKGLKGHLYSDPKYKIPAPSLKIENGTKIYWTTTASGNRTWHHQGTVIHVNDTTMS